MSLANPVVLNGLSGQVKLSDAGLTGDKSVWCKWAPTVSDSFTFATALIALNRTVLMPTSINIYLLTNTTDNPVTIADLSEMPYLGGGYSAPVAYGYSIACEASVTVASGSVYYIRIKPRDGTTESDFYLQWDSAYRALLGSCNSCDSGSNQLCRVGSAAMGVIGAGSDTGGFYIQNPGGNGAVSFGNQRSGRYIIEYCGGGFDYASYELVGGDLDGYWVKTGDIWTFGGYTSTNNGTTPWEPVRVNCGIIAYSGVVETTSDPSTLFGPVVTSNPNNGVLMLSPYVYNVAPTEYSTFGAMQIADSCVSWSICHTGGAIAFYWNFKQYEYQKPNASGLGVAPNPILMGPSPAAFSVYYFDLTNQLVFSVSSISNDGYVNGIDRSSGFKYALTLNIANNNRSYSSGTFYLKMVNGPDDNNSTILAIGADSLSPATAIISDISASSNGAPQYTFNSTAMDSLFGTFQIIDCAGNYVSTIRLNLANALATCYSQGYTQCGSGTTTLVAFSIYNTSIVPCSGALITVNPRDNPNQCVFADASIGTPCNGPFNESQWQFQTYVIEPQLGRSYTGPGEPVFDIPVSLACVRSDATMSQNCWMAINATIVSNHAALMPAFSEFVHLR